MLHSANIYIQRGRRTCRPRDHQPGLDILDNHHIVERGNLHIEVIQTCHEIHTAIWPTENFRLKVAEVVEVEEVEDEVRDGIPSASLLSGIARASPADEEASRNETQDLKARSALAEASECANDLLTMSTNAEDQEVTRKIDTSDEHMRTTDMSLSDGLDEKEGRASP